MGSDFSKPAERYVKKKWPRSRKPKYRDVGVQTDPMRYSIGVQTDFPDDDYPDYGHPQSSSNNEETRSFGVQADEDSSDDDDDEEDGNQNAYQPRRYSSAEKGKGIAGDDGGSQSSQYDPIYDSDRSGPSRYRPPLHHDYGDSGYNGYGVPYGGSGDNGYGVPYGGGYYDPNSYNYGSSYDNRDHGNSNYGSSYDNPNHVNSNYGSSYDNPNHVNSNYGSSYDNPNPSSYNYGSFFDTPNPSSYNYGSYYDTPNPSNYNNYDNSYANSEPYPLDDPWNYQPADKDTWGEGFASDAANQLFSWVNPYEQGQRY